MKLSKTCAILITLATLLSACAVQPENANPQQEYSAQPQNGGTQIVLQDDTITVDGQPAGKDPASAVYVANDIVYYEAGKDFTYGEGTAEDAHTAEEAAAHTVVHIGKPGTYVLSGKLSKGQIAVDLGDGAKKNPEAVVTLILNGVDITCEVAPGVIFYNVYECGDDDADRATKDVNTDAAGANVVITDGTVNTVNGSYVARIYEPGTVVLNDSKTKVEDADKLHKYDAAFYSRRSMNIYGGQANTGVLNIQAENEGLDSELHLTIHGGNIHIASGNDGINTNEDGVSVTTINGGNLTIRVTGQTGEGDGIDSNGWLVINGGTVIAEACASSADAGIDSDMGIHIHGGTVIASGSMLDRIADGGQNYAVFNFAQRQTGKVTLKNAQGDAVMEACPENGYSVLICSSPALTAGTYTLWSDGKQLAGTSGDVGGRPGMGNMGGMPGERPEGMRPGLEPPEGMPEDMQPGRIPPEGMQPPEGVDPPHGREPENQIPAQTLSSEFIITDGGNSFSVIAYQ